MKNNVPIMIAGVVVGVVIVGVGAFLIFNSMRPTTQTGTQTTSPSTVPRPSPDVQSTAVNITIKDRAFSLKTVTVKKGTTVTWTNEDSIGHNVVSDQDSLAGGPPSSAPLLAKGGTFSFTFDTVGTFTYHCASHPDMIGTVEVIE